LYPLTGQDALCNADICIPGNCIQLGVYQVRTRPYTSLKIRHLYEKVRITLQTTTSAAVSTKDPSHLQHKFYVILTVHRR